MQVYILSFSQVDNYKIKTVITCLDHIEFLGGGGCCVCASWTCLAYDLCQPCSCFWLRSNQIWSTWWELCVLCVWEPCLRYPHSGCSTCRCSVSVNSPLPFQFNPINFTFHFQCSCPGDLCCRSSCSSDLRSTSRDLRCCSSNGLCITSGIQSPIRIRSCSPSCC